MLNAFASRIFLVEPDGPALIRPLHRHLYIPSTTLGYRRSPLAEQIFREVRCASGNQERLFAVPPGPFNVPVS